MQRYGQSLKSARDLPDFVHEIRPPRGLTLASEQRQASTAVPFELEGDVHALALVDLDKEGLGEYASQVKRLNITTSSPIVGSAIDDKAAAAFSKNGYLFFFFFLLKSKLSLK